MDKDALLNAIGTANLLHGDVIVHLPSDGGCRILQIDEGDFLLSAEDIQSDGDNNAKVRFSYEKDRLVAVHFQEGLLVPTLGTCLVNVVSSKDGLLHRIDENLQDITVQGQNSGS